MKPTFIAAALLALALAPPAGAQTVWRCGNSYSTQPCPGGSVLAPEAPRPAADVAAAHQVAGREQQHASQLHAERARREAADRGGIAGIRDPLIDKSTARSAPVRKKDKPARLGRHQPGSRPDPAADGTWRAAVPSSR